MSTYFKDIEEYNRKLCEGNLIDDLVENTDKEIIKKFFVEVGTEGKNILDVGCATGSVAAFVAEEFDRWQSYKGIDLCEEYVERFNRRQIFNANAEVGNATDLKSQSTSSKDIVICLFIHQHLSPEDGRKALREFRGVVKPEGDVLIGLTVHLTGATQRFPYAHKRAKEAGAEEVETTIWNRNEFKNALEQVDFDIEWDEKVPFDPERKDLTKLFIRARPKNIMAQTTM